MKIAFLLALAATSVLATQTRYDGYQVFEVHAKERVQFDAMVKLYEESTNFDFWTEPRSMERPMDIMVPPGHAKNFVELLRAFKIDYRVKIADVQGLIEKNRNAPVVPQAPRSGRYEHNWTSYSRLSVIHDFMRELATSYPNLVTVTNQGQSYEGRDMLMMKISTGGTNKKAIFVDGGIHAREWVSPAFVTWLISELVENNEAHRQYTENLDWYIMPVINPDGYEFTHTNTRLWRKNRRPSSPGCIGTDLNRNFGFHWDEGGSSDIPCSDTYNGGEAFSEVESQIVRDTILSIAADTACYLSFHSYGQYWLTPWGYTSAYPDDYNELYTLGLFGANAIEAIYGSQYAVGTSTNVLYVASGGSDDWAKGAAGIKYSYTLELRDEGRYGFELPASQILPTAQETWEGVKVVADAMIGL